MLANETRPAGAPHAPGATSQAAAPDWEEVARRYERTVYRMAYTLTGDPDEARDLAQDVFVRVYRNLDRYRPGTFEGWLYRITKNLFLDRVRRRARVRIVPLATEDWQETPDPAAGPAEHAEYGVLRDDLVQALQQLPASFRTAVVLTDVEGLTYAEVADALGWPIGTVRSRVHRGRKAMRTALERHEFAASRTRSRVPPAWAGEDEAATGPVANSGQLADDAARCPNSPVSWLLAHGSEEPLHRGEPPCGRPVVIDRRVRAQVRGEHA